MAITRGGKSCRVSFGGRDEYSAENGGLQRQLLVGGGVSDHGVHSAYSALDCTDSFVTRWLANYEVEAHLALANGVPKLRYSHPSGAFDIHIKNLQTALGANPPLLQVHILIDANDIQDVKDISERHLRHFLHVLSFATNSVFKIHALKHVVDWTPGGEQRACINYEGFAGKDIPIPALEQSVLDAVRDIQAHDPPPRLKRALKWFANGVHAKARDDQFAYFWFVIELVAQLVKEPAQVPDKCPHCHGPLHCQSCLTTPLHRPYAKQAIAQLFRKYVSNDPDVLFERANAVRNKLMHGDEIESIEATLQMDFSALVNIIGRVAWLSIFNQYIPYLMGKQVSLLETNRYTHEHIVAGVHLLVFLNANQDDPSLAQMPKLQITMETAERPDEPQPAR